MKEVVRFRRYHAGRVLAFGRKLLKSFQEINPKPAFKEKEDKESLSVRLRGRLFGY